MIAHCARQCQEAYGATAHKVDAHAFTVSELNGVVVIAFAGTKNLENILEDASVWPSRTPSGRLAHAGVVNAFEELHGAVAPYIPKRGPVVFTGHSLGGGIAQLFAEKYGGKVITFGSLRTYLRWYPAPNLDHIRIVCDDDPVPGVPRLLYAQRELNLIELRDDDNEFLWDAADHSIDNYIRAWGKHHGV